MKRRDMMRSLAAAAMFVPPVTAEAQEPVSIHQCRSKADKIAAMMRKLFGGEWRVAIQQDFVLISKKKPTRRC